MKRPNIPPEVLESAAQAVLEALPAHIQSNLNGRLERGLALVTEGAVMPYTDRSQPWRVNLFQVRSANPYKPPFSYQVDLQALTCECPDFERGNHCKHLLAAQIHERARLEILASRPF
jgi:hypothetical protein